MRAHSERVTLKRKSYTGVFLMILGGARSHEICENVYSAVLSCLVVA